MRLDRRAFLYCSIAPIAPLALGWRPRARPIRLALLVPASADRSTPWLASALRGARFGAEEAAHTYELLGREIELVEREMSVGGQLGQAPFLAGVSLADLEPSQFAQDRVLVDARAQIPTAHAQKGRETGGPCFRVGLDAATRASLLAAEPTEADAREVAYLSGFATRDEIVLWHGALTRYGATQLNERFTRRFGTGMDEHAWAAWISVKILAEAVLRARPDAAGGLADWLLDGRARFDGHKGAPLAFHAGGHLIQPLYRLSGARILQLPDPRTEAVHG